MCRVPSCTKCGSKSHYCKICEITDVSHSSIDCPYIKSAAIFLVNERKDKVLFVRDRKQKVWMMPGGICDKGETPTETAYREFGEETNLYLDRTKVKSRTIIYRKHNKTNFTQIHILTIKHSLDLSKFRATSETDEITHVSISDLKKVINGTLKMKLRGDNFNTLKEIFDNGIL